MGGGGGLLSKSNLHDRTIILLLGLLSFGNLGGAATPLRIVAIPFFVFAISTAFSKFRSGPLLELHLFLFSFSTYMLFSLGWSIDYAQAIKEIVYFFVHAALLLSLVYISRKAVDPVKSVCAGWVVAVMITLPVAIVEFVYDWHLPVSVHDADTMINYGEGQIVQKTFASVTFGNWNGYVTFLCFSLPFVFGAVYKFVFRVTKALALIAIIATGVVVVVNASRGGLVAYFLVSALGFIKYLHSKSRTKLITIFVFFALLGLGGWFSYDALTFQLMAKLDSASLVEDEHRNSLLLLGLELLISSNFLGVGVGSIVAAYEKIGANFLLPHNVFLELLLQYGIFLFSFFIFFLVKIYFLSRQSPDSVSRFIVFAAIVNLPISGVINSGYWLSPLIWCYLASVFIVSFSSSRVG